MKAPCFRAASLLLLVASAAIAQRRPPVEANSVIDRPERLRFSATTPAELRAPAGFAVSAFASGLGAPRMMALGPDGTVYVTRGDSGDVVALRDTDGDGRADSRIIVASNLRGVHGITIHEGRFYFATMTSVYMADAGFDGRPGPVRMILDGLPNGGQHARRTVAFGPDGMMYISVGSTCNDCVEPNPENATMLRASSNGASRTIYARGLRNTLGWAWHPRTRELWGFDHGSDFRGNDVPPEELNLIREGGNYGWPFCYGQRVVDRWSHYDPPGMTPEAYCASTEPSALNYQAHSAPIGMVFYTGSQFPAQFEGDAFVAMHGSWNRSPVAPAKVIRVRFQNGRPYGAEDFLTGFLTNGGRSLIGRPAGLLVAADGALLISDDANGAIYRVSYGNPSPTNTNTTPGSSRLQVPMLDADGRNLGTLTVSRTPDGIEISGTLRGLTRGAHGIHLHTVGQCVAPFTSAGGHWNPLQRQHGTENPQGPHAGDMLNIVANANGVATVRVISQGGSLYGSLTSGRGSVISRGEPIRPSPTSIPGLIDEDGASIVVHAEADDYRSDPSGNSGARFACGVIPRR